MFKIIGIFFLLLVFVAPLRRFLFWLVVGKQMVREQKKYEKQQSAHKREGEISVDYVPKHDPNSPKKGGQYIDYEDVK